MEKFTVNLKAMLLEKLYVIMIFMTVVCANAVLIVTVGTIQGAIPLERALIGLAISLTCFGGILYLTIKAKRRWKIRLLPGKEKEQSQSN